jgi:hypothetical protein
LSEYELTIPLKVFIEHGATIIAVAANEPLEIEAARSRVA